MANALDVYERHFGMESELFYARYAAHDLADELPHALANTWAGLYEEFLELKAEDAGLAGQVERNLLALS